MKTFQIENGVLKKYNGDYMYNPLCIPIDVIKIGKGAFYGVNEFVYKNRSVIIPDSVVEIEEQAFLGYSYLVDIKIPNSVTKIGIGAFAKCGLKNVKIPNNIKKIEERTFLGCTDLEEIELPNSLLEIGISAFSGCKSLKKIVIPNNVTKIEMCAFNRCTNLEEIFISNSIIEIDNDAFYHCDNLTKLIVNFDINSEMLEILVLFIQNLEKITVVNGNIIITKTVDEIKSVNYDLTQFFQVEEKEVSNDRNFNELDDNWELDTIGDILSQTIDENETIKIEDELIELVDDELNLVSEDFNQQVKETNNMIEENEEMCIDIPMQNIDIPNSKTIDMIKSLIEFGKSKEEVFQFLNIQPQNIEKIKIILKIADLSMVLGKSVQDICKYLEISFEDFESLRSLESYI